ncbi:MAG: molybdopterin-dependent oxidoreductase [bacterium]
MARRRQQAAREETWIPTTCHGCFNSCAIRVRTQDGRVTGLRGDPDVVSSRGKACGKALARIADLYDPNRVTTPLKRTNPVKGLGVDPRWQPISWDEAMDTIVGKLDAVRKDDPRKLVFADFDQFNMYVSAAFTRAFGSPNFTFINATYCGSGLHTQFMLTHGTVNSEVDLRLCNYILLCGSQLGLGANNNTLQAIAHMADARRRGARLVVIDPICSHAAAKADEWVPILPGTDGAFALGMVNVLLNELGICDAEFLKRRTNGPYLIGDDGHYVREEGSLQPLVWDLEAGEVRPYDAPVKDYALEGSFLVGGKTCRPAFALLKEHVRAYSPENVAEITTIPAETIRRLAKEFAEAAQIGATTELGGRAVPFRPAAIEWKRGASAHKNGMFTCIALQLMNIVVGAMDVPGGELGTNPIGPFNLWRAEKGPDGILTVPALERMGRWDGFMAPYPPIEARPPDTFDLRGLFPVSGFLASMPHYSMHDPERFHLPYQPAALILCRTNFLMSFHDPNAIAEWLGKLDFILAFARQVDETSEFADIVLPETHDFERYWLFPANQPAGMIVPGPGPWHMQICQPVVAPPAGLRNWLDVLMEIGKRLGILGEMNAIINQWGMLEAIGGDKKLEREQLYTAEEICKRQVGAIRRIIEGKDHEDALFQRTSSIHLYEKTPEEAYAGTVLDVRIPIYYEHFIEAGQQVEKVTRQLGMDWWDTSWYRPLPDWHPCSAYAAPPPGYDLFLANSKLPLLGHTINSENAWVDDIATRSPLDYRILLHTSAAEKRGIRDGDRVCVESTAGKVQGRVRVTECVHPQVVGTLGILGHWAHGKPISRGKGVNSNSLQPFGWDMVDPLSGQIDVCARVKIYKVQG